MAVAEEDTDGRAVPAEDTVDEEEEVRWWGRGLLDGRPDALPVRGRLLPGSLGDCDDEDGCDDEGGLFIRAALAALW